MPVRSLQRLISVGNFNLSLQHEPNINNNKHTNLKTESFNTVWKIWTIFDKINEANAQDHRSF